MGLTFSLTLDDINILFRRYNKSGDGLLKYSEFMRAICPLNQQFADQLKNRRAINVMNRPKHAISLFKSETYSNFVRALESLIDTELQTHRIKGIQS